MGPSSLLSSSSGGPALSDRPHSHCHAGRHFQGDAEWLLCQILQAGSQHERGGLDGLQAWQKPQGNPISSPLPLPPRKDMLGYAGGWGREQLPGDPPEGRRPCLVRLK